MRTLVFRLVQLIVLCALSAAGPAWSQQPNAGRDLAANCYTCHGTNGNSVGGLPPPLAGRSDLYETMKEFQSGKRSATVMHQQAKGYTDAQLQLMAAYFAALKPAPARLPSKP